MTEHDPITGEVREPCPMCGSVNVRWRERRWHDVVRTNVRWYADRALGSLLRTSHTQIRDVPLSTEADQAELDALRYRKARDYYEDQAGGMTARRFWKCSDCGEKGEEFNDGIAEVLAERERIVHLETRMAESDTSVLDPIDDQNLRPPPRIRLN